MVVSPWQAEVRQLAELLSGLSFRDPSGRELDCEAGFARWLEWTLALREGRRTVYLVGNGASASMASHFAADLAKNGHLHTQVFSDLSLITAISNDMGYEHVFAEPLRRRAQPQDMLVAISSSGNSPNLLCAAEVAREKGLHLVTLTAMGPDNALRQLGDLNLYVGARTYGLAETAHAAVLHHWMDQVEVTA